MTKQAAVLSAVLAVGWWSATAAQGDQHLKQLAEARARWTASRTGSYEFTLNYQGLYSPSFPKAVSFSVVNGAVKPITDIPAEWRSFFELRNTIDKLFTQIEGTLKRARWQSPMGPATSAIEYDKTLGYPVNVRIDPDRTIADDEISFGVTGFKAVSQATGAPGRQ